MKYIVNHQVVLSRPLEGPLAAYIPPFAAWASEQGYARYSRYRQVLLAACFSRWLEQAGIALHQVSSEHRVQYLLYRARRRYIARGHVACYPRKPRGCALDEFCKIRLSFCCASDGCRRRCTPPSVRFLGRKVYLGTIVVLVMALQHGLSVKRRQRLIEQLDLYPQTLARWRRWWRSIFPASRCWRANQGHFMPPVDVSQLPGALLGRLSGVNLLHRVCLLLRLLAPFSTTSWSGCLRVIINPQKM